MSSFIPPTDDELDAARRQGDPVADELLEELGSTANVNALLAGVVRNDDPLPKSLPSPLRAFLRDQAQLPPFAHPELLRVAHDWAEAHIFSIVTALFCATLPTMYAAQKGVLVLKATRRLTADVDRRVNETGRFVFDVIEPGALRGDGRGIRSCQKIRLVHAAVRRHLRRSPNVAAGEVPINQEDMLGVLFGFSVLTLEATKKLQPSASPVGEAAYYQLWRSVGGILGVSPRLVPPTLAEASLLSERIATRQLAPSEHGKVLTAALVSGMKKRLVHPALQSLPEKMLSELLHPRARMALGIVEPRPRDSGVWRRISGPTAPAMGQLSRAVGRRLFETWIAAELRGKRATFRMPSGTFERWDLTAV